MYSVHSWMSGFTVHWVPPGHNCNSFDELEERVGGLLAVGCKLNCKLRHFELQMSTILRRWLALEVNQKLETWEQWYLDCDFTVKQLFLLSELCWTRHCRLTVKSLPKNPWEASSNSGPLYISVTKNSRAVTDNLENRTWGSSMIEIVIVLYFPPQPSWRVPELEAFENADSLYF